MELHIKSSTSGSRGEVKETTDICGTESRRRRMKSAVGVGSERVMSGQVSEALGLAGREWP